MILYEGKKIDENTDKQELWEIIVDEGIEIPFEVYAEDNETAEELIGYIEEWIEDGDEMGTVEEYSVSY